MEESFDLPVEYKGEELAFKTKLVATGYVSSFHILVNEIELVFEKDDSGDFRVINYADVHTSIPAQLFEAIIRSLNAITG